MEEAVSHTNQKIPVAILGSGNIGSDLMYKLLKQPGHMKLVLLAGIEPQSEGLARARSLGIQTSDQGIDAVLADPTVRIVFDATSARAHIRHAQMLEQAGKIAIDLTPAARGPYVVPPANLKEHLNKMNVNLITCGGQATVPLVYAIQRVTPLVYAEMVSTVASLSAGPGTRQNIDEFTATTAHALEVIGGARRGKAIIILNPADPPIMMRNTIYVIPEGEFDETALTASVAQMEAEVQAYVPGYHLKNPPMLEVRDTPWGKRAVVTMLLEVEGAGDYLPRHAGNLDIMTASARRVGEMFALRLLPGVEQGAEV
jgi:acetaldehyde dehydrogenase